MLILVSYSRSPLIISHSLPKETGPAKFILGTIFTQILHYYIENRAYKHPITLMKMKLQKWASQYQPLVSTHAHISKKCSSNFIFPQHTPLSMLITHVCLFCVLRASSSQNVQQMGLQLFWKWLYTPIERVRMMWTIFEDLSSKFNIQDDFKRKKLLKLLRTVFVKPVDILRWRDVCSRSLIQWAFTDTVHALIWMACMQVWWSAPKCRIWKMNWIRKDQGMWEPRSARWRCPRTRNNGRRRILDPHTYLRIIKVVMKLLESYLIRGRRRGRTTGSRVKEDVTTVKALVTWQGSVRV